MNKQMSIAKLRVSMNEAREELGKAVAGQDFMKAQEVKATLDGLEEQLVVAEEELKAVTDKNSQLQEKLTEMETERLSFATRLKMMEAGVGGEPVG